MDLDDASTNPNDPSTELDDLSADLAEVRFDLDRRERAWRQGAIWIGEAVRRGRLAQGMSQRQLAVLAGLHPATISRLENGNLTGMRFRTLARIVAALNGVLVLHDFKPPSRPLTPEPPPRPRAIPYWLR